MGEEKEKAEKEEKKKREKQRMAGVLAKLGMKI